MAEFKDISFLLKSKQKVRQHEDLVDKGKLIIHNKITRTFVTNTPDQSAERVKKDEP